jgi:SAM-dependent methyltransferase
LTAKESQNFWDRKARTFPRYSPGEENYEAKVLALARINGADFSGKRVLDVGCGTGMYTLRLAQEALKVTAIDLSPEMLKILRNDAQRLGLSNIEIRQADFLTLDLEEDFEVIFCSMCPAMAHPEAVDKLLSFKKAQVVYLGWNGLLRSDVLEDLYGIYRITPKVFDAAQKMTENLSQRGLEIKTALVEGQWQVKFTYEDLWDSVVCNLENYGALPQSDQLKQYLERFKEPDGQYLEKTDYKIMMILWVNHG